MNNKTRAIGIDYGLARIGIALSDERKVIATPYEMVLAAKKLEKTVEVLHQAIEAIEKEFSCTIDEILFGLPLHMDGRLGHLADEIQQVIDLLKEKYPDRKFISWDERLSSVQAEKLLIEGNLSRKKRVSKIDKLSAAIILQSYLDQKHLSAIPDFPL